MLGVLLKKRKKNKTVQYSKYDIKVNIFCAYALFFLDQ